MNGRSACKSSAHEPSGGTIKADADFEAFERIDSLR